MSCLFCDLLTTRDGAADILHEDDDVLVLLHEAWATRGHTVVVAKRHVENASGLPEESWLRVARAFRTVESVVLATTGADRAILMKLGLQVPHLHIHIYPVSRDLSREDVFAIIDGKRPHAATSAEKAELVAALRAALRQALP